MSSPTQESGNPVAVPAAPPSPEPLPPLDGAAAQKSAAQPRDQGGTRANVGAAVERWTRALWERKLASTWTIFFALGALFIVYAPAEGVGRLLLPIVLMVCYFIYGVGITAKNSERFADSLYFMGFLWMLIALIAALFGGKLTATTVFKAFGYALTTTAAGMFLRLLITQFQETLPDRVEHAQEEIDRSVSRFREEVGQAADVIQRFRSSAESGLNDRLQGLTSALETIQASIERTHTRAAETNAASLSQAAETVAARLKDFRLPREALERETARVVQELAGFADALHAHGGRAGDQIAANTAAISAALGSLANRLAQVNVPADVLTRELAELGQELARSAQAFSRDMQGVSSTLSQGVGSLTAALADIPGRANVEGAVRGAADAARLAGSRYETMAAAAEAANRHLTGMSTELGAIRTQLNQVAQSLSQLDAGATRITAGAVAQAARDLVDAQATITAAQTAGVELHEAVSEVLEFIRQRLRNAGA